MKTRNLAIIVFIIFSCFGISAQNIVVTDDDGYTANPSAMLDVKSVTKGFLVPRMTTVQRNAISSPATGLLVFDTNENNYYFFNGSAWTIISYGQIWQTNGTSVYLSDPNDNVGIGTSSPTGKMEVKGDASIGLNEPLFAVVNANSDTVFAVYSEGVRIWVNDDASKASGNRGGFAVGGFCPSKATTNEYLRVTPDSVRIYIQEDYGAKASGNRGGFAVGGFAPSKGLTSDFLFVNDDSTRVCTGDTIKGFGVKNIGSATKTSYMLLNPLNHFIGHEAGRTLIKNPTYKGSYNSFFGYQAGYSDSSGCKNYFIGYKAGYKNKSGTSNIFIGDSTGYFSSGDFNIFLGNQAGLNNIGQYNIAIGFQSGYLNEYGLWNQFIGYQAGYNNVDGANNIYMGYKAGYSYSNSDGFSNIAIGKEAGYSMFSGHSNVFIGSQTGYNNMEGNNNTVVGDGAFYSNYDGSSNISIGTSSLYSNQSGGKNIAIGVETLFNSDGFRNTAVGCYAGVNESSGSGNVFLGYEAGYYETGSNKLYIANSETNPPLIYGDFSAGSIGIGTISPYAPGGNTRTIHLKAAAYPQFLLEASDATSNNKVWRFIARSANTCEIQTLSDVYGSEVTGIQFVRSSNSITNVSFPNGNVGVGTTNPGSHRLFVTSSATGSAGSSCNIENTASSGISLIAVNTSTTATDVVELISQYGTGDLLRMDSNHSGWNVRFRFTEAGNGLCDGSWTGGGADYAEYFPKADKNINYEPGDIMTIAQKSYSVETIGEPYSAKCLGVFSSNPVVIGNGSSDGEPENSVLVGLMGVIPTKVNAENGEIKIGDNITLSSIPGVGMKATRSGWIVGRALENYSGKETGMIKVMVNPSWHGNEYQEQEINQIVKDNQKLKAEIEEIKSLLNSTAKMK